MDLSTVAISAAKSAGQMLLELAKQEIHYELKGTQDIQAEGKFDLYFKERGNFWDFAAGVLLIQEAGGIVADFKGDPYTRNSKNILASNNKAHAEALEIFKSLPF